MHANVKCCSLLSSNFLPPAFPALLSPRRCRPSRILPLVFLIPTLFSISLFYFRINPSSPKTFSCICSIYLFLCCKFSFL